MDLIESLLSDPPMPQARDGMASPGPAPAVDGLRTLLVRRHILSPEALMRADVVQRESGERLESVVTRLGMASEQSLAEAMAADHGLDLIDAAGFPATAVAGPELSPAFLHDVRAVPVAWRGDRLLIAVGNPFDAFGAEALGFAFDAPVDRIVGRSSDIEAAIERLYRPASDAVAIDADIDEDDIERLKDLVSDAPVIRAVNRLIARAFDERASDIHIEPTEDSLAVRFRIDGMLREIPSLPAALRAPLVSRVKIMADLNIAERRLPQDGRMRIAVRGHEIDLRVATAPSLHGESLVMRILDRSRLTLDFAVLGFDEARAQRFRTAIHRPHGIVLVTGPTGSGKTTTLYAALAELNAVERKLLTVEDPIEYRLPGVIQAQVNPAIGLSFGTALRSFLRQDPDIIMVGEIRDTETAQIAVQAALTGHMILSTLHTNTAAGAVSRLIDMGVEPFLLSSVLAGVLAQRLVRRLCAECRTPFAPDRALMAAIPALAGKELPDLLYRAVGCDRCRGSGYGGRIALFDFLAVDETVARLILAGADSRDIAAAGSEGGMVADGLAKAAAGLTTLEEILRVATGS